MLTQERERERIERERRRQEREERMQVDGQDALDDAEEELPTCLLFCLQVSFQCVSDCEGADSSIEAPPSVLPPRKYCDITGLEVRYLRNIAYLWI